MLILSILVTSCLLLYYQHLVSKETHFINSFTNSYGKFIDSSNVNYFFIDGKDNLRWGLKLYLHSEGMIIGDPLNDSLNIQIPLGAIKDLSINQERISFLYNQNNSYLPCKFEISCGQQSKLSKTLKLNVINN